MNLKELIKLSYQGAKKKIKKLEVEEGATLNEALESHLSYMYTSLSAYGEGSFKDVVITDREYHIIMKGIKKLEIINGYLLDKLHETSYMEVRGIDKELKVC